MFGGMFKSVFSVDDQASGKLDNIKKNAVTLAFAAEKASKAVEKIGDRIVTAGATAEMRGFQDIEGAAERVHDSIVKLGEQGPVTTSALSRIGQQALIASRKIDDQGLRGALRRAGRRLTEMSAEMKGAEEEAKGLGSRFQFMADVSDSAALSMRRVSAAAQGFMLASSLMQKNITGIAFSLIFLQFSGFLKLSLAIAAVTLVGGKFVEWMKKSAERRQDMERLANAMFIATGSAQALTIASDKATIIADQLGLSQKREGEVAEALTEAQTRLRDRGISPTLDVLEVFTDMFLVASVKGATYEEALASALEASTQFGRGLQIAYEDATVSVDELSVKGGRALTVLQNETEDSTGKITNFFKSLGTDIDAMGDDVVISIDSLLAEVDRVGATLPPALQKTVDSADGEFIRMGEGIKAFVKHWGLNWNEIVASAEDNEALLGDVFTPFIDSTETAFETLMRYNEAFVKFNRSRTQPQTQFPSQNPADYPNYLAPDPISFQGEDAGVLSRTVPLTFNFYGPVSGREDVEAALLSASTLLSSVYRGNSIHFGGGAP